MLDDPREESPAMIEREPGVVRIAPEVRLEKSVEKTSSPTSSIEEQSFEISIGSISVVVEGDDPAPSNAPTAETARTPARETPRRTSRGLSRHYI